MVPRVTPAASLRVMVSPGVAPPPVMVGVLSLVLLSVLLVPVSLTAATSAAGAAGTVVSTVTGTVVGALSLPAGSVAETLSEFRPSARAALGVMDQLPFFATTAG